MRMGDILFTAYFRAYRFALLTICLGGVALPYAGCGRRAAPANLAPARENLRNLGRQLVEFSGQYKGRMPKDREEFEKFLKKAKRTDEEISKLFTSPRDNREYQIRYGETVAMPDFNQGEPWPIIAAEAEGEHGKRLNFSLSGFVGESDGEFLNAIFKTQ